MSPRAAGRAALLAFAAAAAAFALGPPRLLWENEGLRLQHPPGHAVAALLGAAALAAIALPPRPRAIPVLALAAAFGLAGLAVQRLAWRVEAVEAGLHERTLAGWTRIAWRDVESVGSRGNAVVVRSRDGTAIALATRGFGADDRTRLERTVARRLREASTATGLR